MSTELLSFLQSTEAALDRVADLYPEWPDLFRVRQKLAENRMRVQTPGPEYAGVGNPDIGAARVKKEMDKLSAEQRVEYRDTTEAANAASLEALAILAAAEAAVASSPANVAKARHAADMASVAADRLQQREDALTRATQWLEAAEREERENPKAEKYSRAANDARENFATVQKQLA